MQADHDFLQKGGSQRRSVQEFAVRDIRPTRDPQHACCVYFKFPVRHPAVRAHSLLVAYVFTAYLNASVHGESLNFGRCPK